MINAKRELATARRKLREASFSLTGVYISMLGTDDRAAFLAKTLSMQADITRDLALILRDKVRQAKVSVQSVKRHPSWRTLVWVGPSHAALHFFINGKCIICGQEACGNLGRASHLRKHVLAAELVMQRAGPHKGACAKYGLPEPMCAVCSGDKRIMTATGDSKRPLRSVPCPKCAAIPRVRAKFI